MLLRKVTRNTAENHEELRRREELVAKAEHALRASGERDEAVAAVKKAEAEEHLQDSCIGRLGQREAQKSPQGRETAVG